MLDESLVQVERYLLVILRRGREACGNAGSGKRQFKFPGEIGREKIQHGTGMDSG